MHVQSNKGTIIMPHYCMGTFHPEGQQNTLKAADLPTGGDVHSLFFFQCLDQEGRTL